MRIIDTCFHDELKEYLCVLNPPSLKWLLLFWRWWLFSLVVLVGCLVFIVAVWVGGRGGPGFSVWVCLIDLVSVSLLI